MRRYGCLGFGLGGVLALIGAVLVFSTMGGSFLLVMLLGIIAGSSSDAQFKERDAIVESYNVQCLPQPALVSPTQPRCVANGKEGAMLRTVTLTYKLGDSTTRTNFINYPSNWSSPDVGAHTTVFVYEHDPNKFKLQKEGWISRTY